MNLSDTKVQFKVSFNNKKKLYLIISMAGVLVAIALAAVCAGAYFIPLPEVFKTILYKLNLSSYYESVYNTIIWDIRITRILLAAAVGTALASSGAVYQGVFRNPLIEPYILGVSSGAAFGAALAVVFKFPFSLQFLAFVFGMLAVFLTYSISRINGQTPLVTLILCGVIVGGLFSALVSIFQYVGSEEQLKKLVFWLMGGLYHATWKDIRVIMPLVIIGFLIMWLHSWKLNVLSLGEEEAKTLGVKTERVKLVLMITSTAITAVSVSMAGIIGWVGLMIPHTARLLVGPDHRFLLPLSGILGAIFLIISDTLARTISTGEVPIGIITSILGAPYLLYLLRSRGRYFGG